MPNPTTSKRSLHQHERASPVDVAEGRRLLAEVTSLPWRTAATDDTCVVDADNEEVCALAGNYGSQDEWPQMEARAALIVFAVNHLPALLRAAEQVAGLRETILSAANICEHWADESRNGGWSTHQVEPNRRLAASLRKAALGAAP